MKTNVKYSIGLDIGQKEFHACVSVIDSLQKVTVKGSRKFGNSAVGFADFSEWLEKHLKEALPRVYVMEATGVYYENLCYFLYDKGFSVSVIVPSLSKKYAQSLGIHTKTDKVDSQILARLGAERCLSEWKPFTPSMSKLRKMTRQPENLQGIRSQLNNQLHAQESGHDREEMIENQLISLLSEIDKQLAEMAQGIKSLIENDAKLNRKWKQVEPILGVGMLSFATIVAETNGFVLFSNQRQLTKYAGYDVIENQSGKHSGKTRISKKGNSRIRRILHMPALWAVRAEDSIFAHLYNRIFEKTKIKMKGYTAVQRKLLTTIFHLWKQDEVYDIAHYKKTSEMHEPKTFFPLPQGETKANDKTESAPTCVEAERDRPPHKLVAESLLSVGQR